MVAVETVGTTIEAYGRGEIELEAVEGKGAGQQMQSLPSGKLYNLAMVARFLGWVKPSNGQATVGLCPRLQSRAGRVAQRSRANSHACSADFRASSAACSACATLRRRRVFSSSSRRFSRRRTGTVWARKKSSIWVGR